MEKHLQHLNLITFDVLSFPHTDPHDSCIPPTYIYDTILKIYLSDKLHFVPTSGGGPCPYISHIHFHHCFSRIFSHSLALVLSSLKSSFCLYVSLLLLSTVFPTLSKSAYFRQDSPYLSFILRFVDCSLGSISNNVSMHCLR